MTEVNLKNRESERGDQENEEDGSHSSKKSKELSSEIVVQKGGNLIRNERQGNDVAYLLPYLVLYLDEGKREVRSKTERDKGEDP